MSDLRVSSVTQKPVQTPTAISPAKARLRKAVGEVIGTLFFAPVLKMANSNKAIQGKYGHGGRGERAFRAQLDLQFAKSAGGRMQNSLTEAICDRLARGKGV